MHNWLLGFAVVFLLAPQGVMGQSKDFSEIVDFTPGSDLTIQTDKGSLKLTSWDQNKVEIIARIEAPRDVDRDYAEEVVEATWIEVDSDGRGLRIRSNYDDVPPYTSWNRGDRRIPYIHYEIRAPRQLNLDLNIDRTETIIEGIEGEFRIDTDRCEVEGRDWVGNIKLDMDRGDLRLEDIKGSLDIETDRTDVRIQMIHLDGDSRMYADRGRIELRIPASQAFDLYANVGHRGDLDCDFEVTARTFRRNIVEGTVNGGGPRLELRGDRTNFRLREISR